VVAPEGKTCAVERVGVGGRAADGDWSAWLFLPSVANGEETTGTVCSAGLDSLWAGRRRSNGVRGLAAGSFLLFSVTAPTLTLLVSVG
jgi:hypothetical protein